MSEKLQAGLQSQNQFLSMLVQAPQAPIVQVLCKPPRDTGHQDDRPSQCMGTHLASVVDLEAKHMLEV